jgi:hypothetical protein
MSNEQHDTNSTELEHDDLRGAPYLGTDEQRTDETASSGNRTTEQTSESRTAVYDDTNRGYGCVYGGDEGFLCDDPRFVCDDPNSRLGA